MPVWRRVQVDRTNRLRFVLPISSHMTMPMGSFGIMLLFCVHDTTLHGMKFVGEIKRCFIKRLTT